MKQKVDVFQAQKESQTKHQKSVTELQVRPHRYTQLYDDNANHVMVLPSVSLVYVTAGRKTVIFTGSVRLSVLLVNLRVFADSSLSTRTNTFFG